MPLIIANSLGDSVQYHKKLYINVLHLISEKWTSVRIQEHFNKFLQKIPYQSCSTKETDNINTRILVGFFSFRSRLYSV